MATKDNKLLVEARDRTRAAYLADKENRDRAAKELRFADGDQWPASMKAQRTADGRPCLTINQIPEKADQVIGDIRMNRPAIKVVPVGDAATEGVAEILNGIVRDIEYQSDAETVYDHAGEHATLVGFGSWRIDIEDDPDSWIDDGEIRINRIENALTVLMDPNAKKADGSDAMYGFILESMDNGEFKRQYPGKKQAADFEFGDEEFEPSFWAPEGKTMIAEYFRRTEKTKTMYKYADGHITEKKLPGVAPIDEKKQKYLVVEWYKLSGMEVLEGPVTWKGRYIPIVNIAGKEINVAGKKSKRGIVKFMMDPARAYNYARSSDIETNALAPRAPFLMSPGMVKGHEASWKVAHKQTFPYLLVNADPKFPGQFPMRNFPPPGSAGDMNQVMLASEELKRTSSIHDAAVGARSNETSGIAIRERKEEGDTANFVYPDNLSRGIRYTGKILVDLIPKVYSSERIVRVLNEDGSDRLEKVNRQYIDERTQEKVNFDLSKGRYDARVTVGPSFTTKRQEASSSMLEIMKVIPEAATLIADLTVKNMDIPGAEDIAERLQFLLPPGILKGDEEDEEKITPAKMQQEIKQAIEQYRETMEGKQIDADVRKKELDVEKAQIALEKEKVQAAAPKAEGIVR